MTENNVAYAALRQRIKARSDAFLDYYFGHIDCHRIMCSNSAKEIPQLAVQNPDAKTESHRQLISPKGLHYECHLSFECL